MLRVLASMYSSSLRRSRSFHRTGIGVAAGVIIAGVAFVTAAMFRLELLETARSSGFAVALGGAMLVFGILSIASYGLIRVIEWANRS